MAKLTAKQEKFCQEYIRCSNQSEAYRTVYNVKKDRKPEYVWTDACVLMANPKVAQRVFELQQLAQERTLVTVESLTNELNENRDFAKQQKQPAAMTSATMGKAKIHGLDAQKIDMTIKASVEQVDNLEKGRERALKREKPEE